MSSGLGRKDEARPGNPGAGMGELGFRLMNTKKKMRCNARQG